MAMPIHGSGIAYIEKASIASKNIETTKMKTSGFTFFNFNLFFYTPQKIEL